MGAAAALRRHVFGVTPPYPLTCSRWLPLVLLTSATLACWFAPGPITSPKRRVAR